MKLIIDKSGCIEPRTMRYLMTGCSLFEKGSDRAFTIAGHFPMTPGTIGPVSMIYNGTLVEMKIYTNMNSL